MSKELVISANRHETKVALIEDDQLVEVYFQRANEYSLAGSIHKGRVTRVLPGMQSAFVDVGLERDTFLYVSDFLEEHDDFDKITGDERPVRDRDRGRGRDRDRGRDQREPRDAAPPALPSQAQSVSEAEAAAPAVLPPVEAPVVAVAAPAGENNGDRRGDRPPQEREERERRGRRSRRRRRGGHGFPDSKYASETARPGAIQPVAIQAEPPPEPAVVPESTPVFAPPAAALPPIILPGESLAKYRHASPMNNVQPSTET